mgnify:CR=1 FL=1
MVFDTTAFEPFADAVRFANNFFRGNQTGYGLAASDLAVVIIARHRSTPFAYNDAMWAKYGKIMGQRSKVEDPKTKAAPLINLFNATENIEPLTGGSTLDALAKIGVQAELEELLDRCRVQDRNPTAHQCVIVLVRAGIP